MENLDIRHLKQQILFVSEALRELKKVFCEPLQPRLGPGDFSARVQLKREATMLCSIRAHHRNKIHLNQHLKTLEEQAKFIGDRWKSFERQAQEPCSQTA